MGAIEKPLIQKLGVKPGMKIAALGFSDASFLLETPFDKCLEPSAQYDLIFIRANSVEELRSVRHPKKQVAIKGALWIVYPKGVKTITQNQVFFAGNAEGFTDCKVCSFSTTHTALKFVRRKTSSR